MCHLQSLRAPLYGEYVPPIRLRRASRFHSNCCFLLPLSFFFVFDGVRSQFGVHSQSLLDARECPQVLLYLGSCLDVCDPGLDLRIDVAPLTRVPTSWRGCWQYFAVKIAVSVDCLGWGLRLLCWKGLRKQDSGWMGRRKWMGMMD